MGLFIVGGETAAPLVRVAFSDTHLERDVQVWVNQCPAMINAGCPMLPLGMEIQTKHGLSIDNLFLDGNGTLVAVEMKRGRAPRDVIAQILEYASFIKGLEWDAVDQLSHKIHGRPAEQAFGSFFGRPLSKAGNPTFRLVVAAESFDARVFESAVLLINTGMPLALMTFTYFRVGSAEVLETATVLGDIPAQAPPNVILPAGLPTPIPTASQDSTALPGAGNGYNAWLFSNLARKLTELAEQKGWSLRSKVNQMSLPFAETSWPLPFGDFHFRVDVHKAGVVSIRLHFRTDVAPGLPEFLTAHQAVWGGVFRGVMARSSSVTPNTLITATVPQPAMGDQQAVSRTFDEVAKMTEVLTPLIRRYFAEIKSIASR
ncbi:PDDEXK family nuclease [Nitrospirillum pindoramense]|uniref:DUF91 domain-containing protein n=1 Tax=Nitrospirillum amazonense TaxID=28077 RepID=A0A560HIT4_9PROT|nr:hypothetical protein [Nitrospirillum amazonense]TWB45489.1 hypothetical protein FBZ90_102447 [Nitrospirillum amazonense]